MDDRDGELLFEHVSTEFVGLGISQGRGSRPQYYLRNILQPNSDQEKTFQKFAIIQAIDGIKYTIGANYTGRENQGEFIQLVPTQYQKLNKFGNAYCEINYRNGRFWVTPLKPNNVFINSKRIFSTRVLGFGDWLSFLERSHITDSEILRFLFMDREQEPTAFVWFEDLDGNRELGRMRPERYPWPSSPLPLENQQQPCSSASRLNAYVVSHIMSYLPVHDLKTMRLVSQMWKTEAWSWIQKKCAVRFNFSGVHNQLNPNDGMKAYRYIHEMENSPMKSWILHFPYDGLKAFPLEYVISEAYRADRVIDDVNYLLSTPMNPQRITLPSPELLVVKNLRIYTGLYARMEYELVMKVLQKFQHVLENLNLLTYQYSSQNNRDIENALTSLNFAFPNNLKFTQLKGLTVALYFVGITGEDWLKGFIESVKSVTSLYLCNPVYQRSTVLRFLAQLDQFSNLQELTLDRTIPTTQVLPLLIQNLKNPLRKLRMGFVYLQSNNTQQFETLLGIHATSLHALEFVIGYGMANCNVDLSVTLPPFPNLKTLSVGYYVDSIDRMEVTKLNFGNESTGLCYNRYFPVLQELAVHPLHYQNHVNAHIIMKTFLGTFFPFLLVLNEQEQQQPQPYFEPCKTLIHLDTLYCVLPQAFPTVPSAVICMAEKFPNVHNILFNRARNEFNNDPSIQ